MLRSIEINSFKSFRKKTIPLSALTLLCGFNNCGKSTVIQALRMFCKSVEEKSPLLEGHGKIDELRSNLAAKTDPISFKCNFDDGRIESLSINDGEIFKPELVPVCSYVSADRFGPQISLPIELQHDYFPSIGDRGEFVISFLDSLRNSVIPEKLRHPKSVGITLEFQLAGWLSEIAPGVTLNYRTDPKRDASYITFNSFRPANVGFGLSYCLPILAQILGFSGLSPEKGWEHSWGAKWDNTRHSNGSILLIENPEAHLHPSGQTALGRLIALGAASGIQIVVESQSDHLMDGIRIAVKEQIISSEDVFFHYLSRVEEGETDVITPKLHQSGKLEFWPTGFFDQTLRNRSTLAK